MATEVKRRRGTTAQHEVFEGAEAELTVDTDKWTVLVHDDSGTAPTGKELLRQDFSNVTTLKVDTTYSETGDEVQGEMFWNSDEETVTLVTNGVNFDLGQTVEIHVNSAYDPDDPTPIVINKGEVVYAFGTLGNSGRITVKKMIADGTIAAKRVLGIAAENIQPEGEGKIIKFGKLRKINTNSYNAGDILYVSTSSAGAFQTTAPSAGDISLPLAYVVTKSSNVGEIFVRVTPIDENAYQAYDADLSAIAGLAKTDGNFIVGNGSAWVAESGATARTSLGLGNVEDTALSTYTGQGGALDNQYITNGAGYITGYTETDTLSDVTGRGASTTDTITLDKSSASTGYALVISGSGQESIRFLHTGLTVESTGTFNIDAGASDDENLNLNAGHIYLNNNTDVDGNLGVTGDVTGSNLSISNWNTAYGWGDHSTVGYLTSLPTHNHNNLYYTELEINEFLDGTNSISGYNKSNWDTAFGWGNHASAGYLTSYTETDPVFTASEAASITSTDTTQWDAAYTYSQVGHLPLTGGTITSDLTVSGNLTVSGTTTTVNSTSVTVADNNLTLNAGETGAGVTSSTSGIVVDRGTEADFAFLFVESDDKFKIGTSGNLQTVATRQDDGTATDGGIMFFNNTDKRLDNSSNATLDASGNVTAASFVKASNSGGFLKADGTEDTSTYLTSYTETDPVFSASAASGITSTNINNWNVAYNNHITAVGFNTGTGVLTLTQNDTDTITADLDGRYLTSFDITTQTDPKYLRSDADDTTTGNITIGKADPILILNDTSTNNTTNLQSFITFKAQGTEKGYVGFGSGSNDYLYLVNNNGRIDIQGSTGVFINSDTDISGDLDVDGNVKSQYDGNNYSRLGQNSSGGYIQAYSGAVEKVMFRSYGDSFINGGNVGIGTTSPANDVSGLHIAVASSTDQLYLERTGSATGRYYLGTASNSFFIVDDAQSAERLRIDSSGNMGIGQTNPSLFAFSSKELHVKGGTGTNESASFIAESAQSASGFLGGYYWVNGSATNEFQKRVGQITLTAGTNADRSEMDFLVKQGAGNYSTAMRIDSSGNVTVKDGGFLIIDTGAVASNPRLYFRHNDINATNFIEVDRGTNDMEFWNNGSERMRILSGGGITFNGDTATANALDDYEEGTHDTAITCGTSGTITLGGSTEKLQYTKIGRLVTVTGRVAVSGVSSPTGNFTMSLPFTIADLDENSGRSTGSIKIFNTSTNVDNFFFTALEGNAFITVFKGGSTNGTSDSADTFSGNETIALSITYVAA